MLKINKNENPACTFQEQIVSYLYDESNCTEKAEFETHLQNCLNCAEEIAAFTDIRFSIKEWRETEFSALATPVLQLPQSDLTDGTNEFSENRMTIFENFRNLLGFSKVWTAAFAILAICAGLGFVIFNFSNGEDLAVNKNLIENRPAIKQNENAFDNSSKTELADEKPVNVLPEENSANDENTSVTKITEEKIIKPNDKKIEAGIFNNNELRKTQVKTPSINETAGNLKKSTAKPLKQEPKLTNFSEESEDNSLRLAELFDEVESK